MKGLAFIFVTLVFIYCGAAKELPTESNIYNIMVMHPGVSLVDSVQCQLREETHSTDPLTSLYSMQVETVVCGDSRCRIDIVKLYWDALGRYHRLEVPAGVHLEKAEGESFDNDDYKKLDGILADKNSSLLHVYKDEVVGNETTEGVDGMTGATIVVNTKDYVKGAVWTCYTLWHYTHGQANDHIQNITGGQLSDTSLISMLSEAADAQQFAIKQLQRRQSIDERVVSSIMTTAPSADYETTKALIDYFENTETTLYYNSLYHLLSKGSTPQRKQYFNSLQVEKRPAPQSYYQSLALLARDWTNYDDINGLCSLLESKKAMSPAIIKPIADLLANENFLIARRAYYFLMDCNLEAGEAEQLELFLKENESRL